MMRHLKSLSLALAFVLFGAAAWGQQQSGPPSYMTGTITGTYTLGGTGNLNVSQTTDLSSVSTPTRLNLSNTTLSPSVNTTNVWENFGSFITLNGPGQANGEINNFHGDLIVSAGALSAQFENFEAKVTNGGSITAHNGLLSLFVNQAAGVVTGNTYGAKFQLTQQNASAGAVASYAAIDMEPMNGGGSAPTFYYLIRNGDANAHLVTQGNIAISNNLTTHSEKLFVKGPDATSAVFARWQNSTPADVLTLLGNGDVSIGIPTVVASLPTCNAGAKYQIASASDLLTPAWGATAAGSGAVPGIVQCDGAAWKVH